MKDKLGIASCLEQFAGLFAVEEKSEQAVRLFAASAALLETIGAVLPPADRSHHENTMPNLRAQLGDATFDQAWQEGHTMTLDEALEYALENLKEVGEQN